jgi:hypothetical protein
MWISDKVCACIINGSAIILDIDRDRYFGLHEDLNRELVGCLTNMHRGDPSSNMKRLQEMGFIDLCGREVPYTPVTQEFALTSTRPANIRQTAGAMLLKLAATADIRNRAFSANVAALKQVKAAARPFLNKPLVG